jgi:hypothetical protein
MGAVEKIVSTLLLAAACLAVGPALAEKRVALVIGNSSYDIRIGDASLLPRCMSPLSGPEADLAAFIR